MMIAMYSSLHYLYLQVISQILNLHQMLFLAFGIKKNIWASSALLSLCNTGCYSYFQLRLKNVLFQVIYLFLCLCHFLSVSVSGSLSVSLSLFLSLPHTYIYACVRTRVHTHTHTHTPQVVLDGWPSFQMTKQLVCFVIPFLQLTFLKLGNTNLVSEIQIET